MKNNTLPPTSMNHTAKTMNPEELLYPHYCIKLAAEFAARHPKPYERKDKIIGALDGVRYSSGDSKIESDLVSFCHALSGLTELFH